MERQQNESMMRIEAEAQMASSYVLEEIQASQHAEEEGKEVRFELDSDSDASEKNQQSPAPKSDFKEAPNLDVKPNND